LSTTNPTWTDPGSNPGLRGERPATNHLIHGTAPENVYNSDILVIIGKVKGVRIIRWNVMDVTG
jgi:hypothetical protein